MVHLRLNETESSPNPHINFITALPCSDPTAHEEARQLLRALAAQVRPLMKAHGFMVNSFEEYEYNAVFAGRNWNNGETVEIVLKRPDGSFCPTSWLMSTLCHELAHIKHMNHGPAFQSLWSRLRVEVRQLQDRGYYGDGLWSTGTRLADSARISGRGIDSGDFPEYMCGGAQSRQRPTALRRRRHGAPRREVVPSLHTGRQTAKKRKSGARVTTKYAFSGEGNLLADVDGSSKVKGTGFGKKAGSKRARDERALAVEKRIQMLAASQGQASTLPVKSETQKPVPKDILEIDDSSDDEVEFVAETDIDRRQTLLASEENGDLSDKLGRGTAWKAFENDFNFFGAGTSSNKPIIKKDADIIEISSDEEFIEGATSNDCDIPIASGSTFTTGNVGNNKNKSKGKDREQSKETTVGTRSQPSSKRPKITKSLEIGRIVMSEIDLRKKEALGIATVRDEQRRLGGKPPDRTSAGTVSGR